MGLHDSRSRASRCVGLETEWGIVSTSRENPVVLSSQIVSAYAHGAHAHVRWDFDGEDPLNDARGYRLERAAAHPSQLTDNPDALAPSGDEEVVRVENISMREVGDLVRPRAVNVVCENGARLYVDHAHPEYSSPEVLTPREAVIWDRAGEVLMRQAMDWAKKDGHEMIIYKNNVDGKGAAYGAHENYLVDRSVDFSELIRYLTPFFVTRPIICGAGRVGIGQKSEQAGFQISQRADYVENDVGLETTFNRPIINTRDEPHAPADKYRRLHVIGGDANLFDVSIFLKVGATNLVLELLEAGDVPLALEAVLMEDAVVATWEVSHDPELTYGIEMHDGSQKTALEIQQIYLDCVRERAENEGADHDTWEVINRWQDVLDLLAKDIFSAASHVEWVAKYQLLSAMRERGNLAWDDPKLQAVDVQWHDIRPEKSIVAALDRAGKIEHLVSEEEIERAASTPPTSTRAWVRGTAISRFPQAVKAAGWQSLVVEKTDTPQQAQESNFAIGGAPHGQSDFVRIHLDDVYAGKDSPVGKALEVASSAQDFCSFAQNI